jgi:hypothetical protein
VWRIAAASVPVAPRAMADAKKSTDRIQSRLQSTQHARKFANFIVNAIGRRYLDLANGIVRIRISRLSCYSA